MGTRQLDYKINRKELALLRAYGVFFFSILNH